LALFRKTAACCRATVEGELMQVDSIGNFALTTADYRKIVGGKTAALLECATHMGAYLGGARGESLTAFERFGLALGIAFQIVDDILDLVGDEAKTGKTLGTDLVNKKETLPLILYLQNASPAERESTLKRLEAGVSLDERAEFAAMLTASGAVDAARAEADALVDEALEMIATLRATGERSEEKAQAFDALEALARFVVKRDK
jgi:octaprenyl-diphosphate synthase